MIHKVGIIQVLYEWSGLVTKLSSIIYVFVKICQHVASLNPCCNAMNQVNGWREKIYLHVTFTHIVLICLDARVESVWKDVTYEALHTKPQHAFLLP
jgi:hypothetical protein